MNVFMALIKMLLPRNLFRPMTAPRGRPSIVAAASAVPDTMRDRSMMFHSSGLRWRMRKNAFFKPWRSRLISKNMAYEPCCSKSSILHHASILSLLRIRHKEPVPVLVFERRDGRLPLPRNEPVHEFHGLFPFHGLEPLP